MPSVVEQLEPPWSYHNNWHTIELPTERLGISECDVDGVIAGKSVASKVGSSFRGRLLDLALEYEEMQAQYLKVSELLQKLRKETEIKDKCPKLHRGATGTRSFESAIRVTPHRHRDDDDDGDSQAAHRATFADLQDLVLFPMESDGSRSGQAIQLATQWVQESFEDEKASEVSPRDVIMEPKSSDVGTAVGSMDETSLDQSSMDQKNTASVQGALASRHSSYSLREVVPALWKKINPGADPHRVDDEEAAIRRHWATAEGNDQHDCGVFLPASRVRVSWDMLVSLCLLFELWLTPFEFIYCKSDAMPAFLTALSNVITGLFCLDIVLNFNTGYFEKDRTVMSRRAIARNYLRFWFWADLISTVPIDQIVSSIGGGMLRWVRFGKATKILKTLRYLKLVRSVRLIRSMRHSDGVQQLLSRLRWAGTPLQLLLGLCIHAHCHGCIWALLQPDWLPADTFDGALQAYFDSYYWAYSAITVGELKFPTHSNHAVPSTQPIAIWIMELLVAFERVCCAAMVVVWAVFQALTKLQDHIRLTKIKEDAMEYLKRHQASFASQVQVLYILHETGMVRQRQRHFRDLMDNDLPLEVKRKISFELWNTKLRSLGLIEAVRQAHDHFLVELALVVREEVFASKAVLFRYGDASIASYCVLDGTLRVISDAVEPIVPEFTIGHWIGETALINPTLRRIYTIMTLKIVSLMAVPAEGFQELLSRLSLTSHFRSLCEQHLWKGLCGRCGLFGDHYADSCPAMAARAAGAATSERHLLGHNGDDHDQYHISHRFAQKGSSMNASKFGIRSSLAALAARKRKSDTQDVIHGDLQHFLQAHELTRLVPILTQMGVRSLSDLQDVALSEIKAQLSGSGEELTEAEEQILSPSSISEFHLRAAKIVQRTLFGLAQRDSHFIFLSHSKLQAGTEATLMRTELEHLLQQDPEISANNLEVPVFLDSENLRSLKDVQTTVHKSHNLVVLLTDQVLTRPWVLVEIVTAFKNNITVVPVNVVKPGAEFEFPKEGFYNQILTGRFMSADGMKILEEANISTKDVEKALRDTFRQIAVPYSPHRNHDIRHAELKNLLKRCNLRSDPREPRSPSRLAISDNQSEGGQSHFQGSDEYES